MKQVFYVAHPVSGDIPGNIANVVQWIRWLTINEPSRVYIAPWVAEVQAFANDEVAKFGPDGVGGDQVFYGPRSQ